MFLNLDSALGIEVREEKLILATVQKGLQEYRLQNHLVVDHFQDLPHPELMSRIQQFVRSNGFNRENIILALPRDQVVVREVELPIEVEENLDQVVKSQVDKFEPIEDEPSLYDYVVTKRMEENHRLQLQITMVRPEVVSGVLELFEELDLYPARITQSCEGLQHVLRVTSKGLPKEGAVLILRAEEERAEIGAVTKDRQLFSCSMDLPEGDSVVEALLDRVSEVFSHYPELEEFSAVYLLGSRSMEWQAEIEEILGECPLLVSELELECKAIGESELRDLIPAIGLAVSGLVRSDFRLNLIPAGRRLVGGRPSLVATYVLLFVLAALLTGLGTHGYFQQRAFANELDSQISVLQEEVDQAFEIRDQAAQKKSELEELQSLMEGRQRTLLLLKDLTERIPDDTFLQNLQIQGDQVTMQGYSDQASALLPILLDSPYLASVKQNWITQDQRMGGKDRFNFAATMESGADEDIEAR